jgi:TonB-dependent receptor
MKTPFAKPLLVAAFLAVQANAQDAQPEATAPNTAPSSVVAGEVFDEETKGPLAGVTVAVEKTGLETRTDSNGLYRLEKVPVGEKVLLFFKPGYVRHRVTEVFVREGIPTKQDLVMAKDYANLEELEDFVISGADAMEISIKLIDERKKESSFVDSMGSDDFKKIAASDAGDVMKKVVGVSMQGGKYAVVRGLGGRYSNTTLNGVPLPSPDPDKKAVHMDLFPAGLLESIVTAKTFTPDMPGDFSGGSVNLRTKSMPESLQYSWSVSTGYNPGSNLINEFLGDKGGRTDWLGMDDGTRAMPDYIAALGNAGWPSRPGQYLSDNHQIFIDATQSLGKTVIPTERHSQLNHGFGASFQNKYDLTGMPLGVVSSFSYSRNYKNYREGLAQRMSVSNTGQESVYARYFFQDPTPAPQAWVDQYGATGGGLDAFSKGDNGSKEEVTWGGLAEATLKTNDNNTFKLSALYNQATEDEARLMEGYEVGRSSSNSQTNFAQGNYDEKVRITSLHYTQRSLASVQGKGTHILEGWNDSELVWNIAQAETSQLEPDVRLVNSFWTFREGTTSFPKQGVEPRRIFRDLTETSRNVDFAITVPIAWERVKEQKFKAGYLKSGKERFFSENVYQYFRIRATSLNSWPGNDFNDAFLSSPETVLNQHRDYANRGYDNAYVVNLFDGTDYNGTEDIQSYFLMGDTQINDKWRTIYGARVEESTQEIERTRGGTTLQFPTDGTGTVEETTPMPAASLVFSPNEKTNYRLAYSQTVARPTFRELAPYLSYPYIGGDNYQGNPNLLMTDIRNFDFRWEYFPSESEILGASLFYKQMENVIVEQVRVFSDNRYASPTNADKGTVYGLELEAKKSLAEWYGKLENLFLNMNFTYTFAEIDFPDGMRQEMLDDKIPEDKIPATQRLTGQPEYIFNFGLAYERPDLGWNSYLNYGYVSSKLESISAGLTPNVFEEARHQLDFITTKSFGKNWSAKFTAKNLLDSPYEKFYETDDKFVYSSYKYGITYSIGLSYNFK